MSLRIHSRYSREIQIFQPTLLVMKSLKTCLEQRLYRQSKEELEEEVQVQVEVDLVAQEALAEVEAQDQEALSIQEWEGAAPAVLEVPVDQVWVEEDQDPEEWVDQADLVDIQALVEAVLVDLVGQAVIQEDQVEEHRLQVQDQAATRDQVLEIYLVEVIH